MNRQINGVSVIHYNPTSLERLQNMIGAMKTKERLEKELRSSGPKLKEKISCWERNEMKITKKGMDGSQITGSASSYARKYALNGMFLIDDGKDADSLDNRKLGVKRELPKTSVNTTSGKITPAQAKYLKNLGYSGDVDNMSFEEANAKIKFLLGNKQNE